MSENVGWHALFIAPSVGAMKRSFALVVVPVPVLVLVLTACVQSVAVDTVRGLPDGVNVEVDPVDPQPFASWLDDRTRFSVVTYGSSSCAPVPTVLSAVDPTTIAITFVPAKALVCTADLGPTTHVFDTPAATDTEALVTVNVLLDYETDYEFELELQDL